MNGSSAFGGARDTPRPRAGAGEIACHLRVTWEAGWPGHRTLARVPRLHRAHQRRRTVSLFSKPIESLDDLYIHTLQDIYYAEQQILKKLPTMAEKASNRELKRAFQHHFSETETQVQRLEQIFKLLDKPVKAVNCPAIDGILAEAREIMSDCADSDVRDAAMLSAAQAVEHYEISRYGTLIAFSEQLRYKECAELLKRTLAEEKAADQKLSTIAESRVNKKAA
jgi:ferritin-like metal-binding protein YciE